MQRLKVLIAMLALTCSCGPVRAGDSTRELLWSSVHLNGMHLRLLSPKEKDASQDLYFGNGSLAIDSCRNGFCTGPLTVWKIEKNRLKTGYAPSEGDTLVEFTAEKIVLRDPDGKVYIYAIVPNGHT
jgi:hypothetical protein